MIVKTVQWLVSRLGRKIPEAIQQRTSGYLRSGLGLSKQHINTRKQSAPLRSHNIALLCSATVKILFEHGEVTGCAKAAAHMGGDTWLQGAENKRERERFELFTAV